MRANSKISIKYVLSNIFTKPRTVIREIFKINPNYLVFYLILLSSIIWSIESIVSIESIIPDYKLYKYPVYITFLFIFIDSFIGAYYLLPYCLHKVSQYFTENSTFSNTQTVVAWSQLGHIIGGVLYTLGTVCLGTKVGILVLIAVPLMFLGFIYSVLGLGICVAGLREINEYSINKAVFVFVLGSVIVFLFHKALLSLIQF
ncbi:Yip1 family protein [Candidatus Altiarchaeota archaeon]